MQKLGLIKPLFTFSAFRSIFSVSSSCVRTVSHCTGRILLGREWKRIQPLSYSSFRPLPNSVPNSHFCNMADNRFAVDYAKLGTSKCKKCKQSINKKEPRIAKIVPNPFSDDGGDMKQYHHISCMFDSFTRARATTKKIEDPSDLEGWDQLEEAEKTTIRKHIDELQTKQANKKSPAKPKKMVQGVLSAGGKVVSPVKTSNASPARPMSSDSTNRPSSSNVSSASKTTSDPSHPDNSFREYRKLAARVADQSGYLAKTKEVSDFLKKGSSGDGYEGDIYLLLKLLLPGVVKRVYNLNSKQIVKLFSQIFGCDLDDMVTDLEQGDVSETVRKFYEQSTMVKPPKKSTLNLFEVDDFLNRMSQLTRELDQQRELAKISSKCTLNDLKIIIRLIKHDLRINAGSKHILEALDPNAYEAFQASRDLRDVVDRVLQNRGQDGVPGLKKKLSIKANLMTPVLPMLAEACKSVDMALKKCPNGMYAEIKYDGERVQVHKQGDQFQYFSRSLKPVLPHKVAHIKDYLPKACPHGNSIILDSEILMVDKAGKILPFGSLGIHKKNAFQDATVCLFVFDCLHFNGENLMDRPIKERRKILEQNVTPIKNRIMFSEMQYIDKAKDLSSMIMNVIREGLEGLVLKDVCSVYEPGKRHWLKVKKDYLAQGSMADSADLIVLGAFYGTGNKGGIMSVFLMGVYDPASDKYCTVTKCGNGLDDKTLDQVNKDLEVVKIQKDISKVPSWLKINKAQVPDFVVKDPKKAPVWEIIGAEFSKSDIHTANGISIRFPRVTRFRDDKDWQTATSLPRLEILFKKSKETSDMPDFLSGSSNSNSNNSRAVKAKMKRSIDEEEGMNHSDSNGTNSVGSKASKIPKVKNENGVREPSGTKRERDGTDSSGSVKKVKTEDGSPKKGKQACKYGVSCYQTNNTHKDQFWHPGDKGSPVKNERSQSKSLPNVFTNMVIYIPKEVPDRENLRRYVIAFDGDVVDETEKDNATHSVTSKEEEIKSGSERYVKASWVWNCIRNQKLMPTEER